ncbi:sugar 3,4-ketoisomerase [Flavobacterium flavipallidum]|uniref:FdtA/QdtA family cupin domain-containing protein n=1 Tax=Flavobacterium flavipallidum TaxID=3139140 RepID=A0ABU9HJ11_9FLAO
MSKIALIQLPKIIDPRGNLSFFEKENQIPFEIKRVYWIYDVPGGEIRGSHAFKEQNEVIIALSGSFDVILHDGEQEVKYSLNRSYYGLYVPKMMWRRLENFSTNSLAFVAADTIYDQNDYIRDFEDFKTLKNEIYGNGL